MRAKNSPKKIVQLSDCHLFEDSAKSGYQGINPYKTLECIVDTILQDPELDAGFLVLVTGDISGDDSKQSYQHFYSLIEPLLVRNALRVIPGNHDNNPHYFDMLGRWHLRADMPIEIGDWVIHGLDTRTAKPKSAKGEVKMEELHAIAQSIAIRPAKYNLVALHHHPIVSDSWMDKHELMGSETLLAWLAQQSGIAGLLHGHIHHPLRHILNNGVMIAGAPSTAWQWAMTQEFGVTNESAGYQVITLNNNGTFNCEVRRTQ